MIRVVFDTNVLVSALRSNRGASFALVTMIPSAKFELAISQPLYSEYREVLSRPEVRPPGVSEVDIEEFIDRILLFAETRDIHFSWRPFLRDADDEMILEVAVSFQAEYIVTYNVKDFAGTELFGIVCIEPADFLELVKGL